MENFYGKRRKKLFFTFKKIAFQQRLAPRTVLVTQINRFFICTYFCLILCPVGIKNIVAYEYSNQSALGSGPIKIIPVGHVILCFE